MRASTIQEQFVVMLLCVENICNEKLLLYSFDACVRAYIFNNNYTLPSFWYTRSFFRFVENLSWALSIDQLDWLHSTSFKEKSKISVVLVVSEKLTAMGKHASHLHFSALNTTNHIERPYAVLEITIGSDYNANNCVAVPVARVTNLG